MVLVPAVAILVPAVVLGGFGAGGAGDGFGGDLGDGDFGAGGGFGDGFGDGAGAGGGAGDGCFGDRNHRFGDDFGDDFGDGFGDDFGDAAFIVTISHMDRDFAIFSAFFIGEGGGDFATSPFIFLIVILSTISEQRFFKVSTISVPFMKIDPKFVGGLKFSRHNSFSFSST